MEGREASEDRTQSPKIYVVCYSVEEWLPGYTNRMLNDLINYALKSREILLMIY